MKKRFLASIRLPIRFMLPLILSTAIGIALAQTPVGPPGPAQSASAREAPEHAMALRDRNTNEYFATRSATEATLKLIEASLDSRLSLNSVYFPTALPLDSEPDGGLVPSQERFLRKLAVEFTKFRELRPDAHLILEAHTDQRGDIQYNRALAQRRADRVRNFLIQQGVDGTAIESKALPDVQNLDATAVKYMTQYDPHLSAEQREKILHNLREVVLANNRRTDLVLSTTGQRSARFYPFDAPDAGVLLNAMGRESR